uniref:MBD domain-containing protein n=1 Tax=Strigamia maritima TaxID=126957 RepID=T1IRB8_STRMM
MPDKNITKSATAGVTKLDKVNYIQWAIDVQLLLEEKGLWPFLTVKQVEPDATATQDAKDRFDLSYEEKDSVLSFKKLNELNYVSWKRDMLACLASKGLSKFIDPKHAVAAGDTAADLKCLLDGLEGPADRWDKLAKTYEPKSKAHISRLLGEFHLAQMTENESIILFLNLITQLARDLSLARKTIPDDDIAYHTTCTLPSQYHNVVGIMHMWDDAQFTAANVKKTLIEEFESLKLREFLGINLSVWDIKDVAVGGNGGSSPDMSPDEGMSTSNIVDLSVYFNGLECSNVDLSNPLTITPSGVTTRKKPMQPVPILPFKPRSKVERAPVPGKSEWIREQVQRQSGATAGQWDVYFYTPGQQVKLRSRPEVRSYCENELNEPCVAADYDWKPSQKPVDTVVQEPNTEQAVVKPQGSNKGFNDI